MAAEEEPRPLFHDAAANEASCTLPEASGSRGHRPTMSHANWQPARVTDKTVSLRTHTHTRTLHTHTHTDCVVTLQVP